MASPPPSLPRFSLESDSDSERECEADSPATFTAPLRALEPMKTRCWSDAQTDSQPSQSDLEPSYDDSDYESDWTPGPRPRWPEPEAIIQVFFRAILVVLNFIGVFIVLVAQRTLDGWPWATFVAIVFGLILNTLEVASLTVRRRNEKQFPRLPALCLALCDTIALGLVVWSIMDVISLAWRGNSMTESECPVETCTTREEELGLAIYCGQLVCFVFHLELAGMSLKPWVRGAMNWIVDREADKIKREREQEEKLLGPRCA